MTMSRSHVTRPPVVDYGAMGVEDLLDHLLDDNGLARFIETQQKGIPRADWDWAQITVFLMGFTHGRLTFSPGYLEDLYEMQRGRALNG